MSKPSPGPLQDSLHFLRLLWRLNHAMERRSKEMQSTLGISAPQRMILRIVGSAPGVSAGELAATLHVDRGTLSSALRKLETRKLLQRRGDPADGRLVRLYLTKAGRRYDTDAPRTVEAVVNAVLTRSQKSALASAQQVLEHLCMELDGSSGDLTTPFIGAVRAR